MSKCIKFAAVLALVAGLFLSGQAMAKGFTNLSFEGDYNTRHPTVIKVFQPFLDAAAKQTSVRRHYRSVLPLFHYKRACFPIAASISMRLCRI